MEDVQKKSHLEIAEWWLMALPAGTLKEQAAQLAKLLDAIVRPFEAGSPPEGSRLWRCEKELEKARSLLEAVVSEDPDSKMTPEQIEFRKRTIDTHKRVFGFSHRVGYDNVKAFVDAYDAFVSTPSDETNAALKAARAAL